MTQHLVLSLFPGIGLLDQAFEEAGYSVVRGPDLLWGGDVRSFHAPSGVFEGVIGGPPCQTFSTASAIGGTSKVDLIPEFVRIVNEAQPAWIVMENVRGAMGHAGVPADWFPCILRDWDCGGFTARTRAIWTWPFPMLAPGRRSGKPSHSVMASTWKRGSSNSQYVIDKGFLPGDLSVAEYGRLQGADHKAAQLMAHKSSKAFAVTVLGNGVPLAIGRYVANTVAAQTAVARAA